MWNGTATVRTRSGRVRGNLSDGGYAFKGIPYAAPPFGANRFLSPRPVEAWSGVLEAVAFGPKAPQLPYPSPLDVLIPDEASVGEDCLTLNIWSRELGTASLPVMLWIAGGAFEHGTGAAPVYNGARFARDGIVCVTINYRVGIDGFLYFADGTANLGLLDQVAALAWVHDNIAYFGGDPRNVTIFGQSAGAMSVGMLLSAPRAIRLFHRAIVQSGGAQQVISVDDAARVGRIFASKLGVAENREAIAAISTDRLLQAQTALTADLAADPDPNRWGAEVALSQMPWQPVIDGDLLPGPPFDRILAGAAADIDLMVGATSDEWRLFLVPSGAIEHITPEMFTAVARAYGLPVEAARAAYQSASPSARSGDLFAALLGDRYFRIPALRLADAHAKSHSATYMYEFAWPSSQFDGRLGACHALEVGFVFDTLGASTESIAGDDPPQQLASAMHSAWVAFASFGDAGWPKYDLDRRATMRFDTISKVVDDPRAWERALWNGVR